MIVVLVAFAVEEPGQGILVALRRTELDPVPLLRPRGDQEALIDLFIQLIRPGAEPAAGNKIADRQKQQSDRCKPLLTVNNVPLGFIALRGY